MLAHAQLAVEDDVVQEVQVTAPQGGVGHARLRQAFEALQRDGLALDTLSIGMSDDLEAAIAEGATLVRIGTAIFGPRRTPA